MQKRNRSGEDREVVKSLPFFMVECSVPQTKRGANRSSHLKTPSVAVWGGRPVAEDVVVSFFMYVPLLHKYSRSLLESRRRVVPARTPAKQNLHAR